MNHILIMLDDEARLYGGGGPKWLGSVHNYPQIDGYNLGTMTD